MKFENPATSSPIDRMETVGRPVSRIDGPLKTTGGAPYAYEHHEIAADQAYGYIVGSAIAKGRITRLDTSRAEAAQGVIAVVTASNAGPLEKADRNTARLLAGPQVEADPLAGDDARIPLRDVPHLEEWGRASRLVSAHRLIVLRVSMREYASGPIRGSARSSVGPVRSADGDQVPGSPSPPPK